MFQQMTSDLKQLAQRIQQLPPADRAFLAEQIIAGLDEADVEQAWKTEAIRRRDEVRSGKAKPVASEDVYRQIDALLRK
jgi:putative addiction module component (TIGR02574 family)